MILPPLQLRSCRRTTMPFATHEMDTRFSRRSRCESVALCEGRCPAATEPGRGCWREVAGATSAADHPWLSSLATDRLEKSGPDVMETARHWADRLIGEVRAKTGTELDDASRRELRARLRRAHERRGSCRRRSGILSPLRTYRIPLALCGLPRRAICRPFPFWTKTKSPQSSDHRFQLDRVGRRGSELP